MTVNEPAPEAMTAEHRHEASDAKISAVGVAGVLLVAFYGSLFVIMFVLMKFYIRELARTTPPQNELARTLAPQVPPEPRLQPAPLEDLLQLRNEEDAALQQYGWVDRQAGSVRIPIDRAIELLAQRGLPVPPAGAWQPPAPSYPAVGVR